MLWKTSVKKEESSMARVSSEVLTQEIKKSWQRCSKLALPRKPERLRKVNRERFSNLVPENKFLIKIFRDIISDVVKSLDKNLLFFLLNKDGILLDYISNIKSKEQDTGFTIDTGMSFREESMGTNAISLAMVLKKEVSFSPADHYCYIFHNWYCYAAPIYINKRIIAYLDISTIEEELEKELIVIADLVINLIKKELRECRNDELYKKCSAQIDLSSKQVEVLKLLSIGKTEEAAAEEIGISINTVKYHKKRIYNILNTDNLPAAIIKAIEKGIIPIKNNRR